MIERQHPLLEGQKMDDASWPGRCDEVVPVWGCNQLFRLVLDVMMMVMIMMEMTKVTCWY